MKVFKVYGKPIFAIARQWITWGLGWLIVCLPLPAFLEPGE
jgi:hypothetical protein